MTKPTKPPIYLLDSMAFIFRAYHAMQRQRPMSTRTGIPTAATYVFVNMINKLRKDFAPEYLAAVYDVGAPVHRNEMAAQMKDVQKFNIKTQQFETIEYGGYKANRVETPPDLIQQQPYIRRALEAFRIPILYYEGFEADDVIGTLSCKLAALGHHVYVVSSDKDMMQLVNEDVSILNPTKDNLILDPAGVEKILGVPPERVIDVMALRGDSIDNIPGAPGIGDKGSVELIQQFGTVEAALDRAEEVKKKTYRESLQNNRDNILLSKELVTIHTSVPIEYSLEAMRTQPVDNAACRELFSELEFTTLLKDLAPSVDNTAINLNLKPTAKEIAALLAEARAINPTTNKPNGLAIAIFEDAGAIAEEIAAEPDPESPEPEPPPAENMNLFGTPAEPIPAPISNTPQSDPACRLGLAVSEHAAIEVSLDAPTIKAALTDPTLPKDIHDLKAVLRALTPHSVDLAGVRDDVMLLSYLVNPTHASHTLPDIAARTTSRALVHQPTKDNPADPNRLPEAATAIVRLAAALSPQIAEAGTFEHHIPKDDPSLGGAVTPEMLYASPTKSKVDQSAISPLQTVYNTIDLPLVSVLLHMEQTGVRISPDILNTMSDRLAIEVDNFSRKIYTDSGHRFNINSPKQLGDVLFNTTRVQASGLGCVHGGFNVGLLFALLAARLRPDEIGGGEAGRLVKPAGDHRVRAQPARLARQHDKDRLRDFLGLVRVVHRAHRRRINQVDVPRDQRRKGRFGVAAGVFPQQLHVIGCVHPRNNVRRRQKGTFDLGVTSGSLSLALNLNLILISLLRWTCNPGK